MKLQLNWLSRRIFIRTSQLISLIIIWLVGLAAEILIRAVAKMTATIAFAMMEQLYVCHKQFYKTSHYQHRVNFKYILKQMTSH